MTSLPDVIRGAQVPPINVFPQFDTGAGDETIDLCKRIGLFLDPWQEYILRHSLGEKPSGRWSSYEVAVIVSRQNGKGALLEARTLAGLFLFGEELILHSAHEFKTAKEAFRRLQFLINGSPMLKSKVARIVTSTGNEGIELKSGQRVRYIARSTGSGRGFSGDTILLDEAYNLSVDEMNALMPTTSARPNPQIWYTTSAPDIDTAPCDHLAEIRKRALKGDNADLSYFEWSTEVHDAGCVDDCTAHDAIGEPRTWAKTNPALGIRISLDHVEREYRSMTSENYKGFKRERLGIGNWPQEDGKWRVITEQQWARTTDYLSEPASPFVFAVDVTPDMAYSTIAVAGFRDDGNIHVGVIEYEPSTAWVARRIMELREKWKPAAIVILPKGPAGALITKLESKGIAIRKPSGIDYAQACGQFYDGVKNREVFHRKQSHLDNAVAGAMKYQYGTDGGWVWARKGVQTSISPLVATTLASWGLLAFGNDQAQRASPWAAYV
jgi:hypothetical protein